MGEGPHNDESARFQQEHPNQSEHEMYPDVSKDPYHPQSPGVKAPGSAPPKQKSRLNRAFHATGHFITHEALPVVAGIAVAAGCLAATGIPSGGLSAVPCVMAGGAAAGAIHGVLNCPHGRDMGKCVAQDAAIGAIAAPLADGAGRLVGKAGLAAARKLAPNLTARAEQGLARSVAKLRGGPKPSSAAPKGATPTTATADAIEGDGASVGKALSPKTAAAEPSPSAAEMPPITKFNRKTQYGGAATNGPVGRAIREKAEGTACPSCNNIMKKGTPTAPVPEHSPPLRIVHISEGQSMSNAERRAYAQSEEAFDGAMCLTCQRSQGGTLGQLSRAITKELRAE